MWIPRVQAVDPEMNIYPRDPHTPLRYGDVFDTEICRGQEGPVVPNLRFGTTGFLGIVGNESAMSLTGISRTRTFRLRCLYIAS